MAHTDQARPEVADMFERTLLDSARSDGLPAEATEEAWLRFSGLLNSTVISAAGGHAAARSVARPAAVSRLAAGKYLLLGALGGSVLTFAWFGSPRAGQPTETRAVAVMPAQPTTMPSAVVALQSSTDSGPSLIPEAAPRRAAPARARFSASPASARPQGPVLAKAGRSSSLQSSNSELAGAPSTLTAEVAALDTARAAARAGAYDRALDLLGQYLTDFPAGALRADAEVASMEALYEKGNRTEASRRAARFLVQFPNDPHAAAVRRLLTP